ncbi:ion channel regulatory protein UNC-93 domain-containing protein [Trichoderma breve]|uniref:Ion channel regulatory protein UNC-93 domain-containing protein n=1 Tax=Trichoderma breve TaxID=2034170 RepID=A0A9W9EF57_9HYPO|nr:ion channel regulatory protein UNC-93 domain-containing protein [Trichoderma breve]KAJ4865570.1 ion channel regulatory protein UNC-93 domain-containing protein [Trichoderma breve]
MVRVDNIETQVIDNSGIGNDVEKMYTAPVDVAQAYELPKPYNLWGFNIWAYSHPRVQAMMLGSVLFMTVGMFNVITFIGGAGQQTAWLSDMSNIALYTVFSAFCFVAPACLNYFGLRTTLCAGGIGYAAYAASLWCFNHTGNVPFVIFGGCWCGLSAALLWCAEGTAITSFASEDKKGLYVSIFWSIFQFGVVIGAAIPVGQNWNSGTNNDSRVGDGTYIGLFILMLIGSLLGMAMYPWQKIIREDGSRVMLETNNKTFKEELATSWQVCKRNWWIVFFWPMCWAVNYYNIYQSNDFNGVYFTVRGRALNTFISGVVQIPSAWMLNIFTDRLPFGRRKRAFYAIIYVFVTINAVWVAGYFMMKKTKEGLSEADRVDVHDSGYAAACAVYVLYGFTDATYNCYAYWFIGALSNRPDELSVYASMYRLLNALCQICAFALDLQGYSKEFMFGSSWAFVAAGPIFVLPIIKYWLKDTNMVENINVIEGNTLGIEEPSVETENKKAS